MKTRQGFVSNSSTSSFVVICTEEVYKKALANRTEYGKQLIENQLGLRDGEKITLGDNQYLLWHGELSTEEFGCDVDLPEGVDEYDAYDLASEQWDEFGRNINNLGGVFRDSM